MGTSLHAQEVVIRLGNALQTRVASADDFRASTVLSSLPDFVLLLSSSYIPLPLFYFNE